MSFPALLLPCLLVLYLHALTSVSGQQPTQPSNANLTIAIYSDAACTVLNQSPRVINVTSPIPFIDNPNFQTCASTSVSPQLQAESFSFYTGYCYAGPDSALGRRAVLLRVWDVTSSDTTCSYGGDNLSVWTFQAGFPVNATDSTCVRVSTYAHYVGSQSNYYLYPGLYMQSTCVLTGNYTPNSNHGVERHLLRALQTVLLLALGHTLALALL